MIRMLSAYTLGTAKDFFDQHVAGREEEWMFVDIFFAMFRFCFPENVMKQLRIKWNGIIQGKCRVNEYARELEKYARKFNKMTEQMVVLKFWDGLNSKL